MCSCVHVAPSMVNRKEVHHHHHQSSAMHHHQQQQQHRSRAPPLRPHSTPATLLWLEENYEMAQGVCVPRNTLYLHYVDFCAKHGMTPVNAASFGKVNFYQIVSRVIISCTHLLMICFDLCRSFANNFHN